MGGDIREKWIFIPFIIVYFQYFFVRINSVETCYQEGGFTNCCNNCTLGSENDSHIVQTQQLLCNGTCPVGFYLSSYSEEGVTCMYMYSTTAISPSATSQYGNSATTTTMLTSKSATLKATSLKNSTASSDLGHSTTTTTLLTSTSATLEKTFFCLKCSEICVSCEGSATNCTQCQKGGNCSNTTTESNKDQQQPSAVIIGASVGGGLALIITTVIIVCFVCRRRKRRDTTRMSGILQGRTEGGEKRDDNVTIPPSTNPIYENVERQNEFVDQIPEQGDRILRYARDPTTIDKKKEPKQTDPTRSSSYYQNSATIRRQDNIQDVSAVPEEHKVIEQLGQAPLPPTVKKKSLKTRVSKKIKKLTGKVPPKASPVSDQDTQEEHYLPMGPMESSQDNQEVYEEMEEKLHQNSPTLFAQENYENVEDTLADVPSVVAPPPPPLEQEDYENIKDRFPVPERARTGQKSNSRMPDPPTGAKISQTSSGSEDNKLSEEYINVKKYKKSGPESSKKDDLPSQETTEDLEDYENVKYFNKRK